MYHYTYLRCVDVQGWHSRRVGTAYIRTHTEPWRPFQRTASVHMSGMGSQPQAAAAGSSKHQLERTGSTSSTAARPPCTLTSVAATVWQAVCARPSACRASRHAAWMQVSAVRQWEHACSSTSAALALGVATQPGVHPRGTVSVPRWRSTSAAISQQPVGLFRPDKVSSRLRDQGSMAMAVSASDARTRRFA